MKISIVLVPDTAYAVYKYCSFSRHWNYINVMGGCYNCKDKLLPIGDQVYAKIILEGMSHDDAEKYAAGITLVDLRTLEMMLSGCCPKGLEALWLETESD